MMPEKSRAKAYRIKATECARAALTTELDIKAIYQDLAMQWRELALRAAEKIQRNITGSRLRTRLDEGARLVSASFFAWPGFIYEGITTIEGRPSAWWKRFEPEAGTRAAGCAARPRGRRMVQLRRRAA